MLIMYYSIKKDNPIAVVEAKRTMVDPYVGQDQAKSYADGIEAQTGVRPIIYFTNGYETHMWDDKYSAPRLVWGFYSLEDLEYEMFKHKNKRSLSSVEIDISISGRSYQIEGIKSVYEKFEKGYRIQTKSNTKRKEDRPMLFVHYPKCTTCKRAKKWLDEHQISYEEREYQKRITRH